MHRRPRLLQGKVEAAVATTQHTHGEEDMTTAQGYWEEETGWTDVEGTIEETLDEIAEEIEEPLEIVLDTTVHGVRIVVSMGQNGSPFVLIGK